LGRTDGISTISSKELPDLLELISGEGTDGGVDEFRKRTLDYLMNAFQATSSAFFLANSTGTNIDIDSVITHGIDVGSLRGPYKQYFQYLDPFHGCPAKGILVSRLSDLLPDKKLLGSELYNDFCKKLDIRHVLSLFFFLGGKFIGAVGLQRPQGKSDFTREDKTKASRLIPYIFTALHRHITIDQLSENNWILRSAIEAEESTGLVILDLNLQVVFANTSAQQLLFQTTPIAQTGLHRTASDLPALPKAFAEFISKNISLVSDASESCPARVDTVLPLAGSAIRVVLGGLVGYVGNVQRKYLILRLHRQSEPPSLRVDKSAAESFGLSSREVEIVAAVAKGLTNTQVGESLHISVYTVEKHLQNIFQKLDTRKRTGILSKLCT
jgi:DNA-binding NarL/FixJ family response regulator